MKRNPIFTKMLKTAEDKRKFENFHGLNEPEVKSLEEVTEDEYEYGNQCYEEAMSRIDEHEVFLQECKAFEEHENKYSVNGNLLDADNEMSKVNGKHVHEILDNDQSDLETLVDFDDEFDHEMIFESENSAIINDEDIDQELLDQEFDNEDNIMIDLDDGFGL